jgi:hypothetical protein
MMNPFEKLANAIILKAVADYRQALRRCNQHSEKEIFRRDKDDLERFLHSDLFVVLTNLDPEIIIRKLCEEVA